MVSVMPDTATVVRTSFTSVLKLFFLEGKLIGVCSLAISIKSLAGSSDSYEGALLSRSARP